MGLCHNDSAQKQMSRSVSLCLCVYVALCVCVSDFLLVSARLFLYNPLLFALRHHFMYNIYLGFKKKKKSAPLSYLCCSPLFLLFLSPSATLLSPSVALKASVASHNLPVSQFNSNQFFYRSLLILLSSLCISDDYLGCRP